MDQVSIKYTYIFHCKTLQNLPKFGFLVWKQTIWQPWGWLRERELNGAEKLIWRTQNRKIFLQQTFWIWALVAWHGGHRVRLQNIRSLVLIPPGCKVFRCSYIHCSNVVTTWT
jgi:hypothetical protein